MDFGTKSSDLYCMIPVVLVSCMWNILNLVVSVFQQLRVRRCQTLGLVISCVSLSNVLLELCSFSLVAGLEAGLFCVPDIPSIIKAVIFCWFYSSCMSFWSVAWLTVFYCVKIVNTSSPLTKAVKRNISSIINTMLVLTALGSFLMHFPLALIHGSSQLSNLTANANYSQNGTCELVVPSLPLWITPKVYVSMEISVLCLLPLVIMLTTSLKFVSYLCKHMLTMRRNSTEIQSTDSYLLVCKLTVSLILVYLTTLTMLAFFYISCLVSVNHGLEILVPCASFYSVSTAVLLTALNKHLKDKLLAFICCKENSRLENSTENIDTALS